MYEEKEFVLEMIAFSTVDGHLHKRIWILFFLIANQLNIEKGI
jgi:hypothetical protein